MEYLDFVIENYIWFLVGGIVLLMTIIGYIAEKTEFGKKTNNKKEKVSVKEEIKTPVVPVVEDAKEETRIVPEEDKTVEDTVVEPALEESSLEDAVQEDMKEEPMEDLDAIEIQEPTVLEEEIESTTSEETPEEEIPEELYAGLDGTPNLYKNESEESEETFNMDLPDIDALKEESDTPNLEDDDIWKF